MTEQETQATSVSTTGETRSTSHTDVPEQTVHATETTTAAAPSANQGNGRAVGKAKGSAPAVPPSVGVIPPKKIVRKLSVGMELEGKVKRLSEFGAFVDIGVGRDGLVHISEVSVKRVNKIHDVLKVGDVVRVWIKELDRERNRISLTMIPPGTKTMRDLVEGEIVTGTVTRLVPYGAFVDIGVEREGMLHVREMGEGYVAKPEDVVKVGDTIEVRIHHVDVARARIDLSLKGLHPQQEETTAEEPAVEATADRPEEDLPSVIEIAFEKARRAERRDRERRERIKRRSRDDEHRLELDEVIERTLRLHRERD